MTLSTRLLQTTLVSTLAFTIIRTVRNAYRFHVTHHRRAVPKLQRPLRVVQLSDLHVGPYVSLAVVRAWVVATNAQNPDLIIITGDFVDQWFGRDLEALAQVLSNLRAPLGVWGVWGNHDHARFDDMGQLEQPLNRAGIRILTNRGVMLRDDLYLAGVDDLKNGVPDLSAALQDKPAETACLLLSHNPDFLPHIPLDVELTLCGHTHGGQIDLPGLGPLFTSSAHAQRFAAGWIEEPELAAAYVSRGLGVVLLPARLNCAAELTVFDLLPTV